MLRFRMPLCLLVLSLVAASALLGGCSSGPDAVANKFVSAISAKKYVEASGYLGGDLSNGEATDSSSQSALIPALAKPDFKTVEQGDGTAKVVSASDKRNYILLSKVDGNWKITEVCYFSDSEVKEPIPYETSYSDDRQAWEGIDVTTNQGQNGEVTYKVTTKLLNGQSSEESKDQTRVDSQPVTQVVKRGTKPRSAGWKVFIGRDPYYDTKRFKVTKVERGSGELIVSYSVEDVNHPDLTPISGWLELDGLHRTHIGGPGVSSPQLYVDTYSVPNADSATAKNVKVWVSPEGGISLYHEVVPLSTFYPGPFY